MSQKNFMHIFLIKIGSCPRQNIIECYWCCSHFSIKALFLTSSLKLTIFKLCLNRWLIYFCETFFVNFDLESKYSSTFWVLRQRVNYIFNHISWFIYSNILLKLKCVRWIVLSHPVFYIIRITIVCDNAFLITLM